MKQIIFVFIFAGLTFNASFSQSKRTANWYFGYGAAISFKNCEPIPKLDCAIGEVNSTACMSDEDGNLLYYIDDKRVTNKNHELMENGDGIDFYNWNVSQAIITIPKPSHNNKYLALTIGDENRTKLLYHEIDMSNGLGKVTVKNKQVFDLPLTMKMSAVNHANGKDVWVVVQGLEEGKFYVFLITEDGVSAQPVVSDFKLSDVGIYEYGPIKFSPDGSTMVTADTNGSSQVLLYRFDNQTGKLDNEIKLNSLGYKTPEGFEFSPNNQLLYMSARQGHCYPGTSYLYQCDLSHWSASSINHSWSTIKKSSVNYGFLQLAPDGKIYMGGRTTDCDPDGYLHVITRPDKLGLDCEFKEHDFYLGGKTTFQGLVNFNQSYFNGMKSLSLDKAYQKCPDDTLVLDAGEFASYQWSNGNTNQEVEIVDNGNYEIEVINDYGCHFSQTFDVTEYPSAKIEMADSAWVCQYESKWLSPGDYQAYLWSSGESTKFIEAQKEGYYRVEVLSQDGCKAVDSTYLKVLEAPHLVFDDIELFDGDTVEVDPGDFINYYWSNGSMASSLQIVASELSLGVHDYSLYVENDNGCSARDDFTITILPLDEPIEEEIQFSIIQNKLKILNRSRLPKNSEIIIYSLTGKVCYRSSVPASANIEVPFLHRGIYVVVLKSEKDRYTQKIAVN